MDAGPRLSVMVVDRRVITTTDGQLRAAGRTPRQRPDAPLQDPSGRNDRRDGLVGPYVVSRSLPDALVAVGTVASEPGGEGGMSWNSLGVMGGEHLSDVRRVLALVLEEAAEGFAGGPGLVRVVGPACGVDGRG